MSLAMSISLSDGRASLFRKPPGITAGSGVFLFIFHRKRHEIHVRLGVFGCDHGRQEHRIPLFDHDRTVGLLGKFSRRDGNLAVIPQRNDLRRLFVHHHIFLSSKNVLSNKSEGNYCLIAFT